MNLAAMDVWRQLALYAGGGVSISTGEGTRGSHGLTIDYSPNSELEDSGDTGPLLEIRFL